MESMIKQNGQNAIWDFPEDDVFYEELRRQVLILTAEDDEECRADENRNAAKSLPPRFGMANLGMASPVYFYNWSGNDAMDSVQQWPVNSWNSRTGSGTGVFIPQTGNKSRRRNKQRRGRAYKPV